MHAGVMVPEPLEVLPLIDAPEALVPLEPLATVEPPEPLDPEVAVEPDSLPAPPGCCSSRTHDAATASHPRRIKGAQPIKYR
jgi:hypothetical protein